MRRAAGQGEPPAPAPYTVFLDRDGVFNRNPHVGVRLYRNLEWLPGAREAFARLNVPGIRTCLCTNQPWVGLLTATPGMMRRLHERFRAELAATGGRLDRIEVAYGPLPPLHLLMPLGLRRGPGLRRLKPAPGMLEDGAAALAADGWPVDRRRAVMVGDKLKDAQAAEAFGIPCILLATTTPADRLEARARGRGVPFLAIVPDLAAAVDAILGLARA